MGLDGTNYTRTEIDWPQAFPPEEYKLRLDKVRASLVRHGFDAIYVNTPANLTYLTGYDMIYYGLRTLTGLFVRADSDDSIFFDHTGHTTLVSTTPEIRDIVWFERWLERSTGSFITRWDSRFTQVAVIAGELSQRHLLKGTIALETFGYTPHATVMAELEKALALGGAKVVAAPELVEEVRLVKSPREIGHVRQASAIADAAMSAARDALRPGITETEIEGILIGHMMKMGGGYPAIRSMIGSGPRAGTHHAPATQRQVSQGELVFIDFCGCYFRYHVNLNRTFSLGPPDRRWSDLMDRSAGCVDAVVQAVKPGDPLRKVLKVADEYLDTAGLRPRLWGVMGYSLGIAVPPDWVGRHGCHRPPPPGSPGTSFEPGMILNFENQFDVHDERWPGGSGAAYIETFLMTDGGIEVLSKLPRTIVAV